MLPFYMKRVPKRILQTAAVVGWLTLWAYQLSPKIGYIHHEVAKELKDTLWKKEILADQETNDIIKLMSWTISQEEFDALLLRHGHKNDSIKINTLIQPDEVMYKTILEMQTKYGNPKILLWWSFRNLETWDNEPTRARFNPITNTIHAHQLDSVLINFDNLQDKENFYIDYVPWLWWLNYDSRQKYLINNWIAELAHTKQLIEKWIIKMWINCAWDYVRSWFNHDKTYYTPWTIEYQAHKIYEPQLAQEFIQIYQKYINKTSGQKNLNMAKLYMWFFDTFRDEKKASEVLENLAQSKDPNICYFLWKSYFELYKDTFDVGYGYMEDDIVPKIIFWKEYTAKTFFGKVVSNYKKAYDYGKIEAGSELVEIISYRRFGEYNDLIIKIGEDLLTNHINDMRKETIGNICAKLWNLYYHIWDSEKWQEYLELSDTYWWWYSYWY